MATKRRAVSTRNTATNLGTTAGGARARTETAAGQRRPFMKVRLGRGAAGRGKGGGGGGG